MFRVLTNLPLMLTFSGLALLGLSIAALSRDPAAPDPDPERCVDLVTIASSSRQRPFPECSCQDYAVLLVDARVFFCQPNQQASVAVAGGRAVLTCTCAAPAGGS